MARLKKWRGVEVAEAVAQNVAMAMGEFGLEAEGESKRVLRRGHGVESGTLRRSIHVAQPGYNWRGDDVKPSQATPERGGKKVHAVLRQMRITLQLGSGLRYALPVHQGHHSFEGYHYLTIGVQKAREKLPNIFKKYRLRK